MRSRLLASIGALAFAFGGMVVSAGPAAADQAHCYGWTTHPDLYAAGGIHFKDGTYIRRGPYLDCDGLGLGYSTQGIDTHCFVPIGNEIWFYVRDLTTGVNGWARSDTVRWDGSPVPYCYN